MHYSQAVSVSGVADYDSSCYGLAFLEKMNLIRSEDFLLFRWRRSAFPRLHIKVVS
jgi:hypothetical protein